MATQRLLEKELALKAQEEDRERDTETVLFLSQGSTGLL